MGPNVYTEVYMHAWANNNRRRNYLNWCTPFSGVSQWIHINPLLHWWFLFTEWYCTSNCHCIPYHCHYCCVFFIFFTILIVLCTGIGLLQTLWPLNKYWKYWNWVGSCPWLATPFFSAFLENHNSASSMSSTSPWSPHMICGWLIMWWWFLMCYIGRIPKGKTRLSLFLFWESSQCIGIVMFQ